MSSQGKAIKMKFQRKDTDKKGILFIEKDGIVVAEMT
jgi:hypothetical protein